MAPDPYLTSSARELARGEAQMNERLHEIESAAKPRLRGGAAGDIVVMTVLAMVIIAVLIVAMNALSIMSAPERPTDPGTPGSEANAAPARAVELRNYELINGLERQHPQLRNRSGD